MLRLVRLAAPVFTALSAFACTADESWRRVARAAARESAGKSLVRRLRAARARCSPTARCGCVCGRARSETAEIAMCNTSFSNCVNGECARRESALGDVAGDKRPARACAQRNRVRCALVIEWRARTRVREQRLFDRNIFPRGAASVADGECVLCVRRARAPRHRSCGACRRKLCVEWRHAARRHGANDAMTSSSRDPAIYRDGDDDAHEHASTCVPCACVSGAA